jgi:hypothetical protein
MIYTLRQAMHKVRCGVRACQSEPVWSELSEVLSTYGGWAHGISTDEAMVQAKPTASSEASPLVALRDSITRLCQDFIEFRCDEINECKGYLSQSKNRHLEERSHRACPLPLGLSKQDRNQVWRDAKRTKGGCLPSDYVLWQTELAPDGSVAAVEMVMEPPFPAEFQRDWGPGWAGEVGQLRAWLLARGA